MVWSRSRAARFSAHSRKNFFIINSKYVGGIDVLLFVAKKRRKTHQIAYQNSKTFSGPVHLATNNSAHQFSRMELNATESTAVARLGLLHGP